MAAADWQPPPTYELPIQVPKLPHTVGPARTQADIAAERAVELLGQAKFSPNWLRWFLQLAQLLSSVGAGGGSITHNLLGSLQGGTTDEYYHLTQALYNSIAGNQTANTVFAGPTTGAAAPPSFRALVTADIANNLITNAQLVDMAQSTIKGRAVGAGTGDPTDLTSAQAAAVVSAANVFLRADGTVALAGAWSMGNQVTTNVNVDSGAIDGTTIGAASRAAVSCTTLDANGSVVLGDTSADGLTVAGGNITWSVAGGPTHSNNHVFSGFVIARGGTTVTPYAVSTSQIAAWVTISIPLLSFINSSLAAGSRHVSMFNRSPEGWGVGFHDDAFTATQVGLSITGSGTGVTLLAVPLATSSVFGHTASVTVGNAGKTQVVGTTDATSQTQISRHSADASGPSFAFGKSRNASAGGNTIVQSGDILGQIIAYGANGSTYTNAAAIRAEVDATPGASNDMPGRLVALTTPDASGTLTEAWRVDSAQKHIFQVDRAPRFNNQTSAAGVGLGTLTNAPVAGDPGFWLKINVGGTNYAIPCWAG